MSTLWRLQWRCRRGMLELDTLLLDFLDRRYRHLDQAGRQSFERLLDYADADLMDFLTGRCEPADPEISAIILTMRETDRGTP
jgi:antitoxin CptB